VSHKDPQKFHVTAADQETDCKGMPEQMTMQPIYTGLNFHVLVKHFDRVISDRLPGTQSQKHCAGSDMHKFKYAAELVMQEVRDQYKPAFIPLTS